MNRYGKLLTLLVFVVLNGMDVVTTHYDLLSGAREGNPLAAWLLQAAGEPVLDALKISVISLVVLIASGRNMWYLLLGLDAVMFLVVVNNLSHV